MIRSKVLCFYLLSLILIIISHHILFLKDKSLKQTDAQSKVYVVYLGKTLQEDVELITSTHHGILLDVIGSKEDWEESMIYSCRHGFSGFAAKLTKAQAQKIAVMQNPMELSVLFLITFTSYTPPEVGITLVFHIILLQIIIIY